MCFATPPPFADDAFYDYSHFGMAMKDATPDEEMLTFANAVAFFVENLLRERIGSEGTAFTESILHLQPQVGPYLSTAIYSFTLLFALLLIAAALMRAFEGASSAAFPVIGYPKSPLIFSITFIPAQAWYVFTDEGHQTCQKVRRAAERRGWHDEKRHIGSSGVQIALMPMIRHLTMLPYSQQRTRGRSMLWHL